MAGIASTWSSQGGLYLAVVLDLFSQKVIGWARTTKRADDLVLAALRMALAQRSPQAELLHHSDQGSQDTSKE